ncbi:glycosyl hydrolase family 28-related protein [Hymenobacter rigui]|uniref:T9SS C-terminal target domain-containing protein n=1 Tax=Hymenobacter rigui TaxID=334424 RepID=A0A428KUB4_9BACT|nr:glycosyl hydrolase family 28-related protein [Hymenobacter rigui]RSK50107.1 T9SS C-terminal target domain-containing protein [Hymenobacter rigui]
MTNLSKRIRAFYAPLLLISLLQATSSFAQITALNIKDFGAVGDGVHDDHDAFQAASCSINSIYIQDPSAKVKLYIPEGTYIVGRQIPKDACVNCCAPVNSQTPYPWSNDNNYYLNGEDVLRLIRCYNVEIVGDGTDKTLIRYKDGLKYGSFDPLTGQPSANKEDSRDNAATVGACIKIDRSENITIRDLSLNGNVTHAQIGNRWGDDGIQLQYTGIIVTETSRVNIDNVSADYFGQDGVCIRNITGNMDMIHDEEMRISNSSFNYNVRQGFSLLGVNGLTVLNSKFNHTGRAINTISNTTVPSNPGCGVDVEPEDSNVANVKFAQCEFIDNYAFGVGSMRPLTNPNLSDTFITTKNILFSNCTLWGVKSGTGTQLAASVTQRGFRFEYCNIYGQFTHGSLADNANDATAFYACTFEDKRYNGQPAGGDFLVNTDGRAQRMRFELCSFISNERQHIWDEAHSPYDPELVPVFSSCTFINNNQIAPISSTHNLFNGVKFEGNIGDIDSPSRSNFARTERAYGKRLIVPTGSFVKLFSSNVKHKVWDANFTIGGSVPTTIVTGLEIGSTNAMYITGTKPADPTHLYIGENAYFLVKQGGALAIRPNTVIDIAGTLVVEDGAYICIDPSVQINVIGNGKIYIAPTAIIGQSAMLDEFDYKCTNTFPVCVAGGNPNVVSSCPQSKLSSPLTTPSLNNTVTYSKAYPSPTTGKIHFDKGTELIAVYDAKGQAVNVHTVADGFSLQHLPNGLYTLRLLYNNKYITQRIVLEK